MILKSVFYRRIKGRLGSKWKESIVSIEGRVIKYLDSDQEIEEEFYIDPSTTIKYLTPNESDGRLNAFQIECHQRRLTLSTILKSDTTKWVDYIHNINRLEELNHIQSIQRDLIQAFTHQIEACYINNTGVNQIQPRLQTLLKTVDVYLHSSFRQPIEARIQFIPKNEIKELVTSLHKILYQQIQSELLQYKQRSQSETEQILKKLKLFWTQSLVLLASYDHGFIHNGSLSQFDQWVHESVGTLRDLSYFLLCGDGSVRSLQHLHYLTQNMKEFFHGTGISIPSNEDDELMKILKEIRWCETYHGKAALMENELNERLERFSNELLSLNTLKVTRLLCQKCQIHRQEGPGQTASLPMKMVDTWKDVSPFIPLEMKSREHYREVTSDQRRWLPYLSRSLGLSHITSIIYSSINKSIHQPFHLTITSLLHKHLSYEYTLDMESNGNIHIFPISTKSQSLHANVTPYFNQWRLHPVTGILEFLDEHRVVMIEFHRVQPISVESFNSLSMNRIIMKGHYLHNHDIICSLWSEGHTTMPTVTDGPSDPFQPTDVDPIVIEDDDIHCSSYHQTNQSAPYEARLYNESHCWQPQLEEGSPYSRAWISFDLKRDCIITAILTQGDCSGENWISTYRITGSLDGSIFFEPKLVKNEEGINSCYESIRWMHPVVGIHKPATTLFTTTHSLDISSTDIITATKDGCKSDRSTLTGNSNATSIHLNCEFEPFVARYIRFYPLEWVGIPSLRIDFNGCASDDISKWQSVCNAFPPMQSSHLPLDDTFSSTNGFSESYDIPIMSPMNLRSIPTSYPISHALASASIITPEAPNIHHYLTTSEPNSILFPTKLSNLSIPSVVYICGQSSSQSQVEVETDHQSIESNVMFWNQKAMKIFVHSPNLSTTFHTQAVFKLVPGLGDAVSGISIESVAYPGYYLAPETFNDCKLSWQRITMSSPTPSSSFPNDLNTTFTSTTNKSTFSPDDLSTTTALHRSATFYLRPAVSSSQPITSISLSKLTRFNPHHALHQQLLVPPSSEGGTGPHHPSSSYQWISFQSMIYPDHYISISQDNDLKLDRISEQPDDEYKKLFSSFWIIPSMSTVPKTLSAPPSHLDPIYQSLYDQYIRDQSSVIYLELPDQVWSALAVDRQYLPTWAGITTSIIYGLDCLWINGDIANEMVDNMKEDEKKRKLMTGKAGSKKDGFDFSDVFYPSIQSIHDTKDRIEFETSPLYRNKKKKKLLNKKDSGLLPTSQEVGEGKGEGGPSYQNGMSQEVDQPFRIDFYRVLVNPHLTVMETKLNVVLDDPCEVYLNDVLIGKKDSIGWRNALSCQVLLPVGCNQLKISFLIHDDPWINPGKLFRSMRSLSISSTDGMEEDLEQPGPDRSEKNPGFILTLCDNLHGNHLITKTSLSLGEFSFFEKFMWCWSLSRGVESDPRGKEEAGVIQVKSHCKILLNKPSSSTSFKEMIGEVKGEVDESIRLDGMVDSMLEFVFSPMLEQDLPDMDDPVGNMESASVEDMKDIEVGEGGGKDLGVELSLEGNPSSLVESLEENPSKPCEDGTAAF